jgi:BirA family biotin operon repressor/biotin-[acetyl-CoA-carboxylase] ligase
MGSLLTLDQVAPLLQGRFGVPYVHAEACASTQRLLHGDEPEGATAVAEEQTDGRGRLGRPWVSPAGASILCSILLRPPPGRELPIASLVAGIAIARGVEQATGLPAQVKWPNDVLLAGRKVAGVLAEARGGAVVIGIGLNVNQTDDELPERPTIPAGSLRAVTGRGFDRAPLLASLLLELERCYDVWLEDGVVPITHELARRDALRGRRVEVAGSTGVGVGIDDGGRLLVETADGIVAIESGEIALL